MTGWGALGPTVIVDGRLVGIWKVSVNQNALAVDVTPARAFSNHEKDTVTKAAERHAAFLKVQLAKLTFRNTD
jgi:hypothetical protein